MNFTKVTSHDPPIRGAGLRCTCHDPPIRGAGLRCTCHRLYWQWSMSRPSYCDQAGING